MVDTLDVAANSNKLWFCTDHGFNWPANVVIIVYAPDEETARSLIDVEVLHFDLDPTIDYDLEEISLDKPFATVLHDGDRNS
jgi:hypothetical protein